MGAARRAGALPGRDVQGQRARRPSSSATLAELQEAVTRVRSALGPAGAACRCRLCRRWSMDALAAVAAAELQPRLGWLFQTLQRRCCSPMRRPALLQEPAGDARRRDRRAASRRSTAQAPLVERRLIDRRGRRSVRVAAARPRRAGAGCWADRRPRGAAARRDAGQAPGGLGRPRAAGAAQRMLREFLLWVRARRRVVDDWGGQDVGGPLALFCRPVGHRQDLRGPGARRPSSAGRCTGSISACWSRSTSARPRRT